MIKKPYNFNTNLVGIYIMLMFALDDSAAYYIIPNFVFLLLCIIAILQKDYLIRKSAFVGLTISLMCWISLSWLWASDKAATELDIQKQFIFLILLFVITHLLKDENRVDCVFKWFVAAGLLIFSIVILSYGLGNTLSAIRNGTRLDNVLLQTNKLGTSCALIAAVSLNFFLEQKKKKYAVVSLLMIILMLASGSRRSFFVLATAVIMTTLLKLEEQQNQRKKLKAILVSFLLIVLAVYIFLSSSVFSNILSRFSQLGKESGDILRIVYLRYGLQSFLEHPICGIGSGNSHLITLAAVGTKTYLHNNYIEMLANLGIIGFILFYSIYYYLLKKISRLVKYCLEARIAFILLICQLVSDVGVTSYCYKLTYIVFALAYTVILQYSNENYKNQEVTRGGDYEVTQKTIL